MIPICVLRTGNHLLLAVGERKSAEMVIAEKQGNGFEKRIDSQLILKQLQHFIDFFIFKSGSFIYPVVQEVKNHENIFTKYVGEKAS